MENRYKVELWIKEAENDVLSSKEINFNTSNENSLRIISNQMEDIFSFLSKNHPAKIVNLNLDNKTINKAIGEYLYSTSEEKNSLLFSSSNKDEQKEILISLMNETNSYYKKYSTNNLFITFGILDYYDSQNRKEVKSAPLVFMPIKIIYDENKEQFYIKQINKELYLNTTLIRLLRRNKKINIAYPINARFSISEYLSYVASQVHLLRWSVNNGIFISTFDLSKNKSLDDLITNQERIASTPLIKSITTFNSEFYNFLNLEYLPLNKRLLTLLPIDNDETSILQKVCNRESLLIRTDTLKNKYHLLNATLSAFLLNNKKVLITYNDIDEKNLFINNFDDSIKPYFLDLNKESLNKQILIDRLNDYDIDYIPKETLDSLTSQNILNNYYDTKNGFKRIINSLRKKDEKFSLSINDLIEKYYSLKNDMIDVEIPFINEITKETLDNYLYDVRSFSNATKKLGCFYKDHPFYGFNKSSMMQEEYAPLKKAFIDLYTDLNVLQGKLCMLSERFNLPYINNLKLTKGLLNILNELELFLQYDTDFFVKEIWNDVHDKLSLIMAKNKKINTFRSLIIDKYGENVFEIKDDYLQRSKLEKKLSKKEIKELRPYFNYSISISIDTLRNYYLDLNEFNNIILEKNNIYNEIPDCFKKHIINDELIIDNIDSLETATHNIRVTLNYFNQNKIPFDFNTLVNIKNKNYGDEILLLKKDLQIIFNKVLNNTLLIQEYFDETLFDFSTLSFEEYIDKANKINVDFISINDYLDFLLSLWKTNKAIKGLGNSLLKEKDYTLYERMFCKRFYYDYTLYLTNINLSKDITDKMIFEKINNYNDLNENRIKLFNSIIQNNYYDSLKKKNVAIKRYEKAYLDEEKNNSSFIPLSRITSLAHETIFNKIPLILVPMKDVSLLLNSEQYHFDAVVILSNRNTLTKETLSSIYRGDQIIVFDNQLISKDYNDDYIDTYESELFISAAKNAFTNVNYIAKTYSDIPLMINKKNIYIKNYIYDYLINEGFEVAKDVVLKDKSVDFIVRVPTKKECTALIINRLPYYSIESAIESIKKNEEYLNTFNYYSINIFPFIFFKNEKEELLSLKETILNNASKTREKKTKIVKKNISDILFEKYITPREYYISINNKNSYSRKELFVKVVENCSPILKSEILSIFPNDGELYISILLRDNKITLKDGFIYLNNALINFRSYQYREGSIRKLDSISNEELIDGITRILQYKGSLEESILIQLILSCLGYKTMNISLYKKLESIIIDLVKSKKLILEEEIVSINNDYLEEKKEEEKKEEDIKLIIRD